jgi:hypothetical protein
MWLVWLVWAVGWGGVGRGGDRGAPATSLMDGGSVHHHHPSYTITTRRGNVQMLIQA